jgi:phage shock protein A
MSLKIIVIAAVLIVLGLVAAYFYAPDSLYTAQKDDASILIKDDQLTPRSISEAPTKRLEEPIEDPELLLDASIDELMAELASTVIQREKIEEALRVVELKVSALEAQLDNIELRGDNPADVQDETLDSFQAMFAEYQDAISAFEQIQEKEIWLEDKIAYIEEGTP